jgi:hypothetical protein
MEFNHPNAFPPVGLLGLFGIKSDGTTPRPGDILQYEFRAEQFWTRAQERIAFATQSITGINASFNLIDSTTGAQLLVPQGKAWYVTGLTCYVVCAVTDYQRGVVVVSGPNAANQLPDALTPVFASNDTSAVIARANTVAFGSMQGEARLLPPGSNIAFLSTDFVGAARICSCTIRYVEVPY